MNRPRPLALAFGVTLGIWLLLAVYALAARYWTGAWGPFGGPWRWAVEGWIAIVLGVGVATAATAARLTARDLGALGPALGLSTDRAAHEIATLTRVRGRGFWLWTGLWTAVAALITGFGFGVDSFGPSDRPGGPAWSNATPGPLLPWALFRNAALTAVLLGGAWIEVALSYRVGRFVERHAILDLLDRSRYAALGRRARRNVLSWAFLSVFSTFLLYVVVVATVVLPARGLRTRLASEKRERLARIRDQIRTRGDALLEGRVDREAALADLIAYEQRLESAGTWPYDTSTLLRAGFYSLIGAGSWIGAALVERALDLLVR